MQKYDVDPKPSGKGFLLDARCDLLSDPNTRVVKPVLNIANAAQARNRA